MRPFLGAERAFTCFEQAAIDQGERHDLEGFLRAAPQVRDLIGIGHWYGWQRSGLERTNPEVFEPDRYRADENVEGQKFRPMERERIDHDQSLPSCSACVRSRSMSRIRSMSIAGA